MLNIYLKVITCLLLCVSNKFNLVTMEAWSLKFSVLVKGDRPNLALTGGQI